MKEQIKTILLILITLSIIISAGFYGWSIYKKQIFYSEKQACVEKCYSIIPESEFTPTGIIPRIEVLKRCSERCDYLPNSFK